MSASSALSGEMYRIRIPGKGSRDEEFFLRIPCSIASWASLPSGCKKAARVLPEPVGATKSACCPDAIAGHASVCAGVHVPNRSVNHRAARGDSIVSTAGSIK